jgi:protein FRA10AC1
VLEHHRFLRSPSPNATTTPISEAAYEKTLAEAYDKKLYKEFVLISLARWREGMVAMRWRTEEEVRSGKGERVCAELACTRNCESEVEVLFAYTEEDVNKEAMVKARVCAGCAERLDKAREREKKGKHGKGGRRQSRSGERRRRSGDKSRSRSPRLRSGEERERRRRRRRDRSGSPEIRDEDTGRRSHQSSRSRHKHRPKVGV